MNNNAVGQLDESRMLRLLGYRLARASIPTTLVFDKAIGLPLDLRRVEYSILVLVDANTDVTPKQLSQALNVSLSYLTVTVDKLVTRGVLVRDRSAADRRSVFLRLTAAGIALIAQADAAARDMESEVLACLTPGEQAILFEVLGKLAAHHLAEKIEPGASPLRAAASKGRAAAA